ncbi:polycystic kidney disease 1-like 2 [Cichlidogyrus casuarinus]|uniref:Polycystic kidney disease 1-like 2 n=1 Tax=Cichlidogyrus casuarinus TaxID=1844966 RepID=A0ABD2PSW8_9PLAT
MAIAGLTCPTVLVGSASACTVTLTSGSGYTCVWQVDGTETASSSSLVHTATYQKSGVLSVAVKCHNLINSAVATASLSVEQPLTNLQRVTPVNVPANVATELVFNFTSGTRLSATFTLAGVISANSPVLDYNTNTISISVLQTTTGTVPYTLTVTDAIGNPTNHNGNFIFDIPPSGLQVVVNPAVATLGTSFQFTINISGGTSINLSIDYGDGTTDLVSNAVWPAAGVVRSRVYATTGLFSAKFVASSGGQTKSFVVSISVNGPVGTYQFKPNGGYVGVGQIASIAVERLTGTGSALSVLEINWGDNTPKTIVDPFIETSNAVSKPVTHTYANRLDYTVTGKVIGPQNTATFTGTFRARNFMSGIFCTASSSAIQPNQTVDVTVVVSGGEAVTVDLSRLAGSPANSSISMPCTCSAVCWGGCPDLAVSRCFLFISSWDNSDSASDVWDGGPIHGTDSSL